MWDLEFRYTVSELFTLKLRIGMTAKQFTVVVFLY